MKYTFGKWQVELTTTNEFIVHRHDGSIVEGLEDPAADGHHSVNGEKVRVLTADCLPLLLMTSDQALAMHVSRKTLLHNFLERVPELLKTDEIKHVFIGPHICEEHLVFEYAGDEIKAFQQKFPDAFFEDHEIIHLSLRKPVLAFLKQWNIPEEIIVEDHRCTYETAALPSYKRWLEQGKPGKLSRLATSVGAK